LNCSINFSLIALNLNCRHKNQVLFISFWVLAALFNLFDRRRKSEGDIAQFGHPESKNQMQLESQIKVN